MQYQQNISANVISAKSNSANCGRVGKKAISAKCAVQKKAMPFSVCPSDSTMTHCAHHKMGGEGLATIKRVSFH